MEKLHILSSFIVFFIVLIVSVSREHNSWIWIVLTLFTLLMTWSIIKFGWLSSYKFFAIGFGAIALLSEVGSKLQKWMIVITLVFVGFWLLKKYVFKA